MPQQLSPIPVMTDVSQGVITKVSHRIMPNNSVPHAVNFVFDETYGEAVTRLGSTLIGTQILAEDNTITGLYNFRLQNGATHLLAVVNAVGDASQSIYEWDGATWNLSLASDTPNKKTRFETFLDNVVRVNGTDAARSWDAGSWIGTGGALDVGNMPLVHFVKVYKDQVCGLNEDGTLYISSVPNSLGTAISWLTGNRTIRINPEDGQKATGLGEIGTTLLIFKERSMFRFNNHSTDADIIVDVGCSSQESVTVGANTLFFFNNKGVWATRGDYPTLISRKVQRWIDGMSASYVANVAAYSDGTHLYVSIGDVTLEDGTAFSNVVLRYSIGTTEWAVLSYANEFRVLAEYTDSSSNVYIVGGDTTARVLKLNTGYTDNGTGISFEIESKELDMAIRGMRKDLTDKIMAFFRYPMGASLQVKVDDGDWEDLGGCDLPVTLFKIQENLKGHYFKIRISGVASVARTTFMGCELCKPVLLDFYEE